MANPEKPQSVRDEILRFLREQKGVTIAGLAAHIGVSFEAVRIQLGTLEKEGSVYRRVDHAEKASAGRPVSTYELTESGEKLFPKNYGALAVELIDGVLQAAGKETLNEVLSAITDRNVARWEARLQGKTMDEKVELLKSIYSSEDPYIATQSSPGELLLIENNCPYYSVARERPALCGVTLSTLRRLLGVEVDRIEKFQSGHGRCVFRILRDKPVPEGAARFTAED
jgi:predicted ArsR family transcriptional regulator